MKLLSKLFGFIGFVNTTRTQIPTHILEAAIEHVVDGIEPRMRYFPGYKKILGNAVATAMTHIDRLVDSIPGPLPVSSQGFIDNPEVKAFFASVDAIHDIFSDSEELKLFFNQVDNYDLKEVCALLCMNVTEKTMFGVGLHENILQRDVMQTALDFSEHKILSPAASVEEVRHGISQCIFDGLITYALQKILAIKHQKQELETQHSILVARLRARQSQGRGLSSLIASATETGLHSDIEQQISDTEQKQQQLPASENSLQYYLDTIRHTLEHPQDFIHIEHKTCNINNMSIVTRDDSSQPSNTIHFTEISIAGVLKRAIAIVRYPRSEILT